MARLDTKTIWLITAVAAVLILALQFCQANRRSDTVSLQVGAMPWRIDVADSPERRFLALGMLARLDSGHGLLLIFEDGESPRLWSKGLQVAADLLWLDETRQIVDKGRGVPCAEEPCPEYIPKRDAMSVLLLPPGTARGPEFEIGQTAPLRSTTSRSD